MGFRPLFDLAFANAMAALALLWFRHISHNNPRGAVETLVAMGCASVGLILIVNALLLDILLLE